MKRFFIALLAILLIPVAVAVTSDEAWDHINQAELILEELERVGLPHQFVYDNLVEAKRVHERAEYAALLQNESLEGEIVEKAREALAGLDYKGFSYEDVVDLTDGIAERRDRTYLLNDALRSLDLKLNSYEALDLTVAQATYEQATIAFEEERFEDAGALISEANLLIDEQLSQQSTFNAIVDSGANLVQKFWITLLIFAVAGTLMLLTVRKKWQFQQLKKKHAMMKVEQKVLVDLMKKTQKDRFEDGSIPQYLYQVKMDKYHDRLSKIKAELPVLAKRVNKKV